MLETQLQTLKTQKTDFIAEAQKLLASLQQSKVVGGKRIVEYEGKTFVLPALDLKSILRNEKTRDYYEHVVYPLLEERYFKRKANGEIEKNEGELFKRVATYIAKGTAEIVGKEHYKMFLKLFYLLMSYRLFMPATPTLMNAPPAGSEEKYKGTLSSCFVLPLEDDMESITDYWKNMALIQKHGGGVGADYSKLRPAGSEVNGTNGIASGFKPFLLVANQINHAIRQGAARSGANMATMRIDHPDVVEFIRLKRERPQDIPYFNLSVTVYDTEALSMFEGYHFNKNVNFTGYTTSDVWVSGPEILDEIAESIWRSGDPGIIFLDKINEWWRETGLTNAVNILTGEKFGDITATNPCGEEVLPPYGSCNLGSVNLFALTDVEKNELAWELFESVINAAVLFLNGVLKKNRFPLPELDTMNRYLRRIGLGAMGLADLLYLKEMEYGSPEAVKYTDKLFKKFTEKALYVSRALGEKHGYAPVFDYVENEGVKMYNSSVTTIAPTGSISLISLANSGIEPFFSLGYKKMVYVKGKIEETKYIDVVPPSLLLFDRKEPKTAMQVSPYRHVDMLIAVSKNVTSNVSKTINVPYWTTKEEIKEIIKYAYVKGAKSITIFRDGCRNDLALVSNSDTDSGEKCPVCGSKDLVHTDGCVECKSCGWSACSS